MPLNVINKMDKKILKNIAFILIGLIIALLISFVVWHRASSADIVEKCQESLTAMVDEFKPIDDPFSDSMFEDEFEEAQEAYHLYIKCLFDESVNGLLGSAGGETEGIFSANAPNLPEWTKPESACLSQEKLGTVVKDSAPKNLIPFALDAYNQYVDRLKYLFELLQKYPTVSASTIDNFSEVLTNQNSYKLLVEDEIQNSIVAMDSAFKALKEMRQAFVMHVQFQCMLKNLEKYRRVMENMREVISAIPARIIDASMHK